MKEFTVKELSVVLGIKEPTLRSWMLKAVEGEAYYRSNINYREVYENIHSKYEGREEELKKKLGCNVNEIRIVKRERARLTGLSVIDLEIGNEYEIRNYSLKYHVQLKSVENYDDDVVYLFKDIEKNTYRVWTDEELNKDNIKIIEL